MLTKGLSFLTSFTWPRLNSATGFLNNNGAGLVDPEPYYSVDSSDRPWELAFSGLYGLPIGTGGALLSNARGFVGQLVNDWQLDWIFTHDGGQPIGYPNTYNSTGGRELSPLVNERLSREVLYAPARDPLEPAHLVGQHASAARSVRACDPVRQPC